MPVLISYVSPIKSEDKFLIDMIKLRDNEQSYLIIAAPLTPLELF